jgi:aspartate carbamoyltransferase catalytic subunit
MPAMACTPIPLKRCWMQPRSGKAGVPCEPLHPPKRTASRAAKSLFWATFCTAESRGLISSFCLASEPKSPSAGPAHCFPVSNSCELTARLDAVMVLRLQRERQSAGFIPTLQEYTRFWGLTDERLKLLRSDARILHPGPANPGIEISANAMADSRSLILTQVEMGIFVRMAALLRAFGRLDS